MLLAVICLCAGVTVVSAQLQCHPETLTYQYVNDISLWGSVGQHIHLTCLVDIDCLGVTQMPGQEELSFDYIVHISNVTFKTGAVSPANAAKLCSHTEGKNSSCTVGGDSPDTGSPPETVEATEQFQLPFVFTQTQTGRILRVEFLEEDFENQAIMNVKKGIVSTLQTRISGSGETNDTVEETDSTGSHTSYYRSRQSGDSLVVQKEYAVDDNSPQSRLTHAAQVRVKTESLVQNGEIVDSRGEVSSSVEEDEDTDDVTSPDDIIADVKVDEILKTNSKFDLKLYVKVERSAVRRKRMADIRRMTFLPTSLKMDSPDESTDLKFEQLKDLYQQLRDAHLSALTQQYLSTGDESYLSLIKNVISLETELGFTNIQTKLDRVERPTVDSLVTATYGVASSCGRMWEGCKAILELYTIGGGRMAEEVFEFLLSDEANLTEDQQIDLANMASFMAHPSDRFVLSLVHLLNRMSEDSDRFSSLLLTLGSVAGETSVSDSTKQIVIAIIIKQLDTITPVQCSEEVRYADALEAIGNMGDIRFLDRLLEVDMACPNSDVTRVAVLHAARGMLQEPRVQELMLHTLTSSECDVSEDLLNLLLEEIQDQLLDESRSGNWPLAGFNDFDEALSWMLLNAPDSLSCLRPDAMRYFRHKLSPRAQKVGDSLADVDTSQHTITKRGVKKHSSCSKWSDFKGRYKNIHTAKQFKADTKAYKKRKHCLAHFGIGPKKANVNVYAGFFAGYTKSKCKLFAKVVAKGKILKKSFTIGTVYLYFDTKGKKGSGRVYAKVGKKTLIDKKFKAPKYKSTKKLYSAPQIKIPLAKIPVYIAKISVDLKLSAKVELTTELKLCKSPSLCLSFKPKAIATATGSATVSVGVVRGGAELKLSLNYFVKGEAQARKNKKPCVSLSHGHDKNTVNLQFFYQIRSKVKVKVKLWKLKFKIKWKWGKKKTYKPSSLKWDIGSAKSKTIYSNC